MPPRADDDIQQIWHYIAAANPDAATRLIARITDRCAMLARQPLIGEPRDELLAGLRSFPVGSYVFYYFPVEQGDTTVEIVRVIHGARNVRRLF